MSKNLIYLFVLGTIIFFGTTCRDETTKTKNISQTDNNTNEPIDSALRELNKRIAAEPDNYAHYLARARYYGDKLLYNQAFEDIARAVQADSTQSEIFEYKASLHWTRQQIAEAYSEYLRCIECDSLNTTCLLKAAGIDIAARKYELATKRINDALKINQYIAEAYYLKGRMYKELRDTSLSKSSYATAIEVDPNYYDAYIELGLLYSQLKSDLAKEYYNSAIALKPKSVEAWYNKAMYLQESGYKNAKRYNEAFACYDSILKIDQNFSPAPFGKGYIWLEYLHNYDSAAYYFSKAIAIKPDYYQAFYNRGLCYESLGKYNEAWNDYSAALSYQPQYDDAAKGKGRVEALRKK